MLRKVITFADTPYVETQWLWKPFIAYSKLNIIHGNMGEGKTTLAVEFLSKFSNGYNPIGDKLDSPKTCLYVSAEDSYEEGLNRRFRISGANMERVIHFDDSSNDGCIQGLPTVAEIANAVKEYHVDAVVIDPILSFINANMNIDNEVRQALEPFRRIALDSKCCIIMISHPSKNEKQSAFYRLSGSGAFGNLVRSISVVGRDSENQSVLLYKCYKCNDAEIRREPACMWQFEENGSLKYIGKKYVEIEEILSTHKGFISKTEKIEMQIKTLAKTSSEVTEKTKELLKITSENIGAKTASFYNARKNVLDEYARKGI